jgi:hypothetical protein
MTTTRLGSLPRRRAFRFGLAGLGPPRHDPRRDMGLASDGVVAILDDNGTNWRPKESFHALAYGKAERTER